MPRLILTLLILLSLPLSARAEEVLSIAGFAKGLRHGKFYLFRPEHPAPHMTADRPDETDTDAIQKDRDKHDLPLARIAHKGTMATACMRLSPYNSESYAHYIGRTTRILSNHLASHVEGFTFQPFFSGLRGRPITIMRRDVERAIVKNQGSPQEVFHNSFTPKTEINNCHMRTFFGVSVDIIHHMDLFDTDKPPLLRSNGIVKARVEFNKHFMGTLGVRLPLFNNLSRDRDVFFLDRNDPIRQDEMAYTMERMGMEHLMVSAFATPRPDHYVAAHAGYIEEKFFGLGGEFLYRPHDSAWSWGGEIWQTYKRHPFMGSALALDTSNSQFSAFANMHYDIPQSRTSLGLSAGRFLDGDMGVEGTILYRPKAGWSIAGFATITNEKDNSLDNDKETNITAGIRVTMPLSNITLLPRQTRQTFKIEPFARDKGQRVQNPYPLYELTDPWSTQNLHNEWSRLLE